MGIPKKGSRRISVDGKDFRWMLRSGNPNPRWDDPPPTTNGGTLTVQEDTEKPGRVVQAYLSWRLSSPVTPEIVREVIRRFLTRGWDPSARGSALQMKDIDTDLIETKDSIVRSVMEP